MNEIFFSIITINKDNANGLYKTIKSVVEQTFNNFEYIIIDGASKDSSVEIINQFKNKINYWISEKDNGVYHAMNKGMNVAKGKYVLFLNSGDYFADKNVLQQVAAKSSDTDFIIGNQLMLYKSGIKRAEQIPTPLTVYHFFRSTIWHQATFTKLSVLKELGGYDENLKITSDWKFIFLALVLHHKSFQALPIDISVFDTYGMSGASDANLIIQKEKTDVLKTYFPYFYPDYITLHRYKHLSFNHIKNTISYFLFKLMRKLNFK